MSNQEDEKEDTAVAPPTEETAKPEDLSETEHAAVEPAVEEKESSKSTPAAAEVEKEKSDEEEIEVVEEKTFTIPVARLGYATDRAHRSPKAVRDVRAYVARHMKADEVSISNEINQALWERGINKPPRKITVRAVKDKEGKVVVYPSKTS
ncbi:MAG: 50S ribosomal protein L31e [Candidatus Bathyarchaeia archaeon]